MEKNDVLDALSALAHQTRLDVFRLLVKAGAEGLHAGAIASRLDVRQNTMSANLAVLERGGLIRSEREGRSIRYYADFDGVRGLLGFLMEDCCGGLPEQCQPLLDKIVCTG